MSHSRHSLSIVLLAAALSLSIAACGREDDAPMECTVANEPFDCGPGAVCELGACIALPACETDADCTPHGLHCLSAYRLCVRAPRCSSNADCQAPTSFCDPSSHECRVPTCQNGGFTCTPPLGECSGDGRCVASKPEPPPIQPQQPPPSQPPQPPQPPAGCASHNDCCPFAPGCASGEVQHCEISKGASTGSCKPGCRTHTACSKVGLDSCNGLYQCIKGGKHGDPCDDGYPKVDLDDCRFGYYCCPVLKECIEQCKTPGETCIDTGKKCVAWFTGPKCF